jgi:NlpC/P60 family putative phage cell wall peptidase
MREQIISAAYSWVGTPYHNHARVKQVGVDCAQLCVGVAIEAGSIPEEMALLIPNYSPEWHLHNREEKLIGQLESFGCRRIDRIDTKAGDIVCFQFGRATSHLGIMVNETQFIHARFDTKTVVCNTMNEEWAKRWTFTYQFPGVEDV